MHVILCIPLNVQLFSVLHHSFQQRHESNLAAYDAQFALSRSSFMLFSKPFAQSTDAQLTLNCLFIYFVLKTRRPFKMAIIHYQDYVPVLYCTVLLYVLIYLRLSELVEADHTEIIYSELAFSE